MRRRDRKQIMAEGKQDTGWRTRLDVIGGCGFRKVPKWEEWRERFAALGPRVSARFGLRLQ
jgi:hypothetical protein